MWTQILGIILVLVVATFLFWKFWFLRMPRRNVPKKGIVSPATGKILKIVRFENGNAVDLPKGLMGSVRTVTKDVSKSGYLIVIMLTALDVHYQRAPEKSKLIMQKYSKGRFKNAVFGSSNLSATFENEKNEMLFSDGKRRFKVVQIAGVLARRIVTYVEKGQKVHKGELIGLINLGSQVMLVLPDCKLKAKESQRVVDGETVVAWWGD